MLEYNSKYQLLMCLLHKYAVANAERHLRVCHFITGKEKDALLDHWKGLPLTDAGVMPRPKDYKKPKPFLETPVPGYACSQRLCLFLTVNWEAMQWHYGTHHRERVRSLLIHYNIYGNQGSISFGLRSSALRADLLLLQAAPHRPTSLEPQPNVRLVLLQTFFPDPNIKWFVVDEEIFGSSDEDHKTRDEMVAFSPKQAATSLEQEPHADSQNEALSRGRGEEIWSWCEAHERAVCERELDRSRLMELQRNQAPSLRVGNASSSFFRLPLEVRQEMYKMILPAGVV